MSKEWETLPFENCIEHVKYGKKIQRKDFLESGKYPVVSQEEDFINGCWNDEADLFRLDRPVVVFGDHTRILKYIDFDFVLGADGVKVLKPKEFLEPKFFYYQLHTAQLDALGYARHFRLLKEHSVSYPTLHEQRRIVSILDAAISGIATAKVNAEKNLQNARNLFDSYVNSIFDDPDEKWERRRLGDICQNLDSQRVPVTKKDRVAGNVPYYGASGVVDSVSGYLFDEDLLLVSEDGANLLARTYPIAFSISGKAWVNNHAHVLRFDDFVFQRMVQCYLNSISLDEYVSGMAQPKLNQKMLNSILIPVPPKSEQRRIVTALEELAMESERLAECQKAKLATLDALKQSLFAAAFAGEL